MPRDEPQVVSDVVDAETYEDAEARVITARGGPASDYTCGDGGALLADRIAGLQAIANQTAEEIERDHQALAAQYADDDEEETR